jgi:hypothetical protein
MEYVSLTDLRNGYIPTDGYIRLGNTIRIVPLYPQNRQSIRVEDPKKKLEWVPDTSFGFIINFRKSEEDVFSELYTSEELYLNLEKAFNEPNPFFNLDEIPTVEIYTDDLKQTILGSVNEEQSLNVELINNMGYDPVTDKFDYTVLVKYIDWLVQPSTLGNDTSLKNTSEYSNYETINPL